MLRLILFYTFLHISAGAKILGFFHTISYSHHILVNPFFEELVKRGHEIYYITPFKNDKPINNYNFVHLNGLKKDFLDELGMKFKNQNFSFSQFDINPLQKHYFVNDMSLTLLNKTFQHPNFQKFLAQDHKFDLVIVDKFYNPAPNVLCHHFKAPCIFLSTLGPGEMSNYLHANPTPPSYIPDILLNYSSKMKFYERIINFCFQIYQKLMNYFVFHPKQNQIISKYFLNSPNLNDLISYQDSIIFVNSHPSATQPVPLQPNIIEIGGFHIRPSKPLPKELQDFMDGAKDGIIFFSLGGNVDTSKLSEKVVSAILGAFSKTKLNVIWKFSKDNLTGIPKNVLVSEWAPQQDILAHPNTKIFITHNGLLSTIEAVYYGVPMISIPCIAEQQFNAANCEANKIAIKLDINNLTEELLSKAIEKILSDNQYTENIKHRSKLMRDRPVQPLDLAVYWAEFMIRHKGSSHLRSSAMDLPWWKYLLLDVITFIIIIVVVPIFIVSKLVKKCKCNKENNKTKLKKT